MPNFVLQIPSLQHLAAVKIAAALWNHGDILTQVAEILNAVKEEGALKSIVLLDELKCTVLALELAKPCKLQLLQYIQPLHEEIYTWCLYCYRNRNENDELKFLNCSLPKQFCWTMHGTINFAKTAQLMVKDQSLTVERRYALACINCLEDEARELIKLIPEVRRREYMNKATADSEIWHNNLIVFFTCALSGDVDQLNIAFQRVGLLSEGVSINLRIFLITLRCGNPAAFEFVFNILSQVDKDWVIGRLASTMFAGSSVGPRSNLLYFWSLLSEEQRARVIRECMGDLLVSLLNWPMQSLFMEAVQCGWRYMAYPDYEKVLRAIARKISVDGDQDYNYAQLFCECWRLTPAEVTRCLLDEADFLERLLKTNQKEIVNLMYNEQVPPSHLLLQVALRIKNRKQFKLLTDEGVISEAALMKCKKSAELMSSNNKGDEEQRVISERVSRFVDLMMESRAKRRIE